MEIAVKKKKKGLYERFEKSLDSRFFLRFMSIAYGLGASVVIIGALFKITHIPGANQALFIGMCTEAIIFALSALQRPHVEPDWSKVHPEFIADYHGKRSEEVSQFTPRSRQTSSKLDRMLEDAKIDHRLIDKLGSGLKKLSDTTAKLCDVSDSTIATKEFVDNIKSASKSADDLSKSYLTTAEALDQEASDTNEFSSSIREASEAAFGLKDVYSEATESFKEDIAASGVLSNSLASATDSAKQMSEKYIKSAETIAKSIEQLQNSTDTGNNFNEQLQKLSNNLSSLNIFYELQLKNSERQTQSSIQLQETLDKFLSNLQESSNNTAQYHKEIDMLTKKMAALNNVYGNMLTAMNVK